MKYFFIMMLVFLSVMFFSLVKSPTCPGTSNFDKEFCVEMLDVKRVRDYACIKENKKVNCKPLNETIDEILFNICGYKGKL